MRLKLLFFATLIFSCGTNSNEWQTLDFVSFNLKTPGGWKILKEKGIDSYVGGLTNGIDTLWFDYGKYDLDFTGDDITSYLVANDTVNGLAATIFMPDSFQTGLVMMKITVAGEKRRFTIAGTNIKNEDTILKLFKSIVFNGNSDTLINPPLTKKKFKQVSFLSASNFVIQECGSCHLSQENFKKLPLKSLIPARTDEWLYKFLKDRKQIENDSAYLKRKEQFDIHCPEFPKLTKEDIVRLYEFYKEK